MKLLIELDLDSPAFDPPNQQGPSDREARGRSPMRVAYVLLRLEEAFRAMADRGKGLKPGDRREIREDEINTLIGTFRVER